MELVRNLALVLHLLGMALIVGYWVTQAKAPTKTVGTGMLHGALTVLVTGLALVGIAEAGDGDVNHTKIGVKLVVLLAVTALVVVNRRKDAVSTGVWGAIGGLTILNVVIAVFW
ncbi:hypothetical protein J4G33_10365 [Actinotalea sp. BY-33]|uniref:Uncharacterized protein n=1 Tax=Actinotalea soli TaxID=2819234 RepID=A0A939LT36_9CELL|nr:hypothetical protein [Actinotalea soli]MBO1752205.1 hypothetical protein [Actinotalea soli]